MDGSVGLLLRLLFYWNHLTVSTSIPHDNIKIIVWVYFQICLVLRVSLILNVDLISIITDVLMRKHLSLILVNSHWVLRSQCTLLPVMMLIQLIYLIQPNVTDC